MKGKLAARLLLLAMGLAAALCVADTTRPPQRQVTAHVYLAGLGVYHAFVHPVTHPFIRCRYRPTCSNYSSLAVKRFGIKRGLQLTALRLWSCRPSVVPGTADPVPVK